jgi:hypothetical protein
MTDHEQADQYASALESELSKLPTTSAKIRSLHAQGFTRSAIALILDIRYQHVRNVLLTPLKRS